MRSGLRTVSLVFLSLLFTFQVFASVQPLLVAHHRRAPKKHHMPPKVSRLAGRDTSVPDHANGTVSVGAEEEAQETIVLGDPPSPWKNQDEPGVLVRVAESFAGAPYKLGGDTVRGLDCSAFVRKMYAIFGVKLPRSAEQQFSTGLKIDRDDLTAGDLVFFRTKRCARYPTHVGIYIGEGQFVHTSSFRRRGVRIDRLSEAYFSKTYAGAVRVKAPATENSDAN
jgi:cell wall-associated NlpC family hydrolase